MLIRQLCGLKCCYKKPPVKKVVAKTAAIKKPISAKKHVAVKKLPSRSHPELQAAFEKYRQNPPEVPFELWQFVRCIASSDDSHIRRSERVLNSKVQKDQADKVSVLCDWCNDDDNEWFYGINETHQMDLFTEKRIHVPYESTYA